jgi:hypothetical protein
VRRLALLALAVAAIAAGGVASSGATFTAASASPGTSFATAADFNTVAVSLADPGSPLRGTVALSATAASDRGIASVRFQYAPAGTSSWTDACTDATAPYSCSWGTPADGSYDVRALATDNAGYTRTSTVAARTVDNTAPAVTLADPGSVLHGTVALSGTASDGSVKLQYRVASTGAWTDICAAATCNWNTAGVTDGLYDLRIVSTDAAGNAGTATLASRRVDNTAPTVALTDPGTPLRGTVTLQSTAADGGSGVASVRYEYRTSPSGAWAGACTAATTPFSCAWATPSDGSYDLRAIATDNAGLTTTSAVVSARKVDNTGPTLTFTDPGSPLSGTVALSGSATDAGSGVSSVKLQYAPAGTSTWTDICAAASCNWNTTALTDGVYDLRLIATDGAGNQSTLARASRRVDNVAPTVSLVDPGTYLRGTATLAANAADGGGIASVAFQIHAEADPNPNNWITACTDTSASYTCTGDTTQTPDGLYDLRAIATDNAGRTTTSAVLTARRIDNTAPTGTDVAGANGGQTKKLDKGDTITFTTSEALRPASVLAGWSGASTPISVVVTNSGNNDLITLTGVNLIASGQSLQTNANWVSANATFAATLSQSGSQIVVTLGTLTSGSVRSGVNTSTKMSWPTSSAMTDLAGNPLTAATVTQSAAKVNF